MQRFAVSLALILVSVLVVAQVHPLDIIRQQRLAGQLYEALDAAAKLVESKHTGFEVELHLEMAKIHDRIGLHNNTRPVAEALEHIETAASLVGEDESARAHVELAYAEYYYRAEMAERVFETAERHANAALLACRELEDIYCQADAVHRLGLIHLQRRELDQALELFEESLRIDRIDRIAGERLLLRADYERHAGFVYYLREDYKTAHFYFRRSLDYRRRAGARDPAMFAAISLSSVLERLGYDDEAQTYLTYASEIAELIDSDTGRARVQAIRERMAE